MGEEKPAVRNFFDAVSEWATGEGHPGPRRWVAQFFALLGTIFALLQLFFGTLDLANRAVDTAMAWLPYLVPGSLIIGAIIAIFIMATAASPSQKRWAGSALGVIVLTGGLWGGWTYFQATRPPKSVIVMIADFNGEKANKGVDWGRRIYERVAEDVENLKLTEQVDVERVFESFDDSSEALAAGAKRKATIVLWGWYDDEGVSSHFELLRTAERFRKNLVAPPKDLADFDIYVKSGPEEMTYIVAVVLGLIRQAEGNYAGAEALFTKALELAPESANLLGLETPHFYRATARLLGPQGTGHPTDAIVSDLQEAVARRPDFWQAHWNLAVVYTDYCTPTLTLDAALTAAQRVQELRPDDAASYWLLGRIHARRGELQRAAEMYQKAITFDPESSDAQEGLAAMLEKLGQQEEAAAAYQRAIELRSATSEPTEDRDAQAPDPAQAADQLGATYLAAGRYDKALSAFQEALRLKPDDPDYLRHLGNAYYWQGKVDPAQPSAQLDRAIAEYEKARLIASDDSLLLTVLGAAYAEAGRSADALAAYEAAVRAAPCDDEALLLLANQYDAMGRAADARKAFEQLSELNPRQAVAWRWLATADYLKGDYASAVEGHRKAIAAESSDAGLYYGLASSLYYLEDYAGAEEAYRQAKELAPEDAATLAGWADALAKLGRVDEAIAAYEQAVAISPEAPHYWLSLGLLYEGSDRKAQAVEAYGHAASLSPDDPLVQASYGSALMAQQQFAEAVTAYEKAIKADPSNIAFWESLAISYSALERPDEALRAAETLLALSPDSALGHLVRGGVSEARGDVEAAKADYALARDLAGDNLGIEQLASSALNRLGD
jgi:tetratricopeptide (TPR) repeat protein